MRDRVDARTRIASVVAVAGFALVALAARRSLRNAAAGWKIRLPGNWWLRDAHGLLIISAQGGPYTEGAEKLP